MQPFRHFRIFAYAAVLSASVAICGPTASLAGDPPRKPDAPRPARDVERRVYTNDDLGWPAAISAAASATKSAGSAAAPATEEQMAEAAAESAAPGETVDPQQDPRWYAKQLAPLDEELANIETRREALRRFRETSAGLPTGLVLDAPCAGITTDNLVAQLDLERRRVLQRLDDLDDLAHRNGLEPGAIAEARAVAETPPPLTAEQLRDALRDSYSKRSDELAQTRAVIAAMQRDTAARGMTLLMPALGAGGNMTTDLLQRLDARASSLQGDLSTIEDDARRAGFQPSLLR